MVAAYGHNKVVDIGVYTHVLDHDQVALGAMKWRLVTKSMLRLSVVVSLIYNTYICPNVGNI